MYSNGKRVSCVLPNSSSGSRMFGIRIITSVTRCSDEKIIYIKAFINWQFWAKKLSPNASENRQNGEKSPNLVTLNYCNFCFSSFFDPCNLKSCLSLELNGDLHMFCSVLRL